MITFDAGNGRRHWLFARRAARHRGRRPRSAEAAWSLGARTIIRSMLRSEPTIFDFLLEGVPNLVANQEVSNYLANYHAASDTFDKVDIRELKLNTALAALTAWGIADRTEPLGKRLTRAELDDARQRNRPRPADEALRLLGRLARRRPRPQTLRFLSHPNQRPWCSRR